MKIEESFVTDDCGLVYFIDPLEGHSLRIEIHPDYIFDEIYKIVNEGFSIIGDGEEPLMFIDGFEVEIGIVVDYPQGERRQFVRLNLSNKIEKEVDYEQREHSVWGNEYHQS